jgi:polysaccharide export outer membrane protein
VAYNSKVYYVVIDGGGYGQQVFRFPITGNETVLDAISQINGLPPVADKSLVWVARATPDDKAHPAVLPVDWHGITQDGSAATNYQIFPGDRIYVHSQKIIRVDSFLAKFLSPIDRVFGSILLGSSAVNSIRAGGGTGTSGTAATR